MSDDPKTDTVSPMMEGLQLCSATDASRPDEKRAESRESNPDPEKSSPVSNPVQDCSNQPMASRPTPEREEHIMLQDDVDCDCFLAELRERKLACEKRNEEEVSRLKATKVETKNIPIKQLEAALARAAQEKELNRHMIKESNLRKKVFLHYATHIEAELLDLAEEPQNHSTSEVIKSLRARFLRECRRYECGLPIFAHRLGIMETVQSSQVCVLVGETGSGKSTQLVQYLHEAGYASNGLIVCTQPRKLAAISLAEHVSREVREVVGGTYGYVATQGRQSLRTRVLFMTDHTLLNECIADPNLGKFSCLVIDEAHERSIHTDMLIALVKRCLPNRPDLKVIITSATIDPTLFSAYFGGTEACPIIMVPGRTYPVDVSWRWEGEGEGGQAKKAMVERDYVSDAVGKVYEIYVGRRNKPGDILVFLTCPAEIERARVLAREALKSEAVVLPLHGKLQPEDQQKVFHPAEDGKRKVVFSTNVAETSVTIPGVVYVVDTGLAKELCYDPQRNTNSLEIRPISKSSADQRRGRAGRTCPGECHRLYSEADYALMRDNSVPEIMRVTLALAVIKLYEFGIADVNSFEFVESPDRRALEEAQKNLEFLGAIERGRLTQLGRKMAMLPLDPNLSKVLFDAIREGIGVEGAAAVSVSTLSGRVFFRPESAESREESESAKLPFCQQSGDQMTHLHTFFQWSRQEPGRRNEWCVKNYVNAKSMRMVREMVKELSFILKEKCGVVLPLVEGIPSLERADQLLPKIFFHAFLQNICVHLGHDRVGYWSERLPDQQLVIHRGSSLCSLGSVPKCVVYERTQKTSQHFLLQALPVHEHWIQEVLASGKLSQHPAEASLFQYYQVSTSERLTFVNLGPRLSWKLFQAYPHDRSRVVPEFAHFEVRPVFEHLKDRGVMRVFVQACHHDEVCEKIGRFIEASKRELEGESFECGLTSNNDDVKMRIGLGGCIQSVLMPGDFQSLVVRGLHQTQIQSAQSELEAFGSCTFTVSSDRRGTKLVAKFEEASNAARALKHHFTSFPASGVKILVDRERSDNCFQLKVEWWRRQRRDYAYINFDESVFYSRVYFSFGGPYLDCKTGLRFDKTRKSIKVSGIRNLTTEEQIRSAFLSYLPPSCGDIEFSVFFQFSAAFEETERIYSDQRECLDTFLSRFAPQNSYYVSFAPLQSTKVLYKAFVNFSDPDTFCEMFRQFRGRSELVAFDEDDQVGISEDENDETVTCSDAETSTTVVEIDKYRVELSLYSSTRYTRQVFSVIKPAVERIQRHYSSKRTKIECSPDRWGNTYVKLTTSDHSAFRRVKGALAKAVEPEVVSFLEDRENQYVSTISFQQRVQEIQEKTSTVIKINSSSLIASNLAIYGTKERCEAAREEIIIHVRTALHGGGKGGEGEGMVECFEVDLRKQGPGLMKHLVEKYGTDVAGIAAEIDGIVATKLVPRRQVLTLFATEAGYQAFIHAEVEAYRPKGVSPQQQQQEERSEDATSTDECCVCLGARAKLFYRLEYCGHVYCKECIEQQLQPTSITFPVTCAAQDCERQLVWRDFESLDRDKVKRWREVASASLKAYVAKHTDKLHECITPDCRMVYVASEEGRRFVCRQCGVSTCTKCHTAWHEGFSSCVVYKKHEELQEWIRVDPKNRKTCPKCSAPIEKTGGCQHVACTQCDSHICWHCLELFPTSTDCYDHLNARHGGFF